MIIFRGTRPFDPGDWRADISIWPFIDRKLGICHEGFRRGARGLIKAIRASDQADVLARSPMLLGHSLGGALAADAAALIEHVSGLMMFNAPCPAGGHLRRALRRRRIPALHWHWRGDIVVDLPKWIGLYEQPVRLTEVGDERDPFEAHSIENFIHPEIYHASNLFSHSCPERFDRL